MLIMVITFGFSKPISLLICSCVFPHLFDGVGDVARDLRVGGLFFSGLRHEDPCFSDA
ncbi:MAG: hypothetical protein MZW92_29725 [Comamonadaceae bacterium]|nr:hypothetical protein [Comamonadaceae bacterium]